MGLYLELLNNGENIICFYVKNLECFSKVCVHTLGDNVMVVLGVVEVERQGDNMTPSWRDPRRMSNGNKIYLEVMLDPTFFIFSLVSLVMFLSFFSSFFCKGTTPGIRR